MSLQCYKYRLPFIDSFQTSKKRFEYREGFILEYASDDFRCYGEAAPLPGYSHETLDEVTQWLTKFKDAITKNLNTDHPINGLQELYEAENFPASLQFGLDSIAYQLQAQAQGSTFPDCLFPDAMNPIPVNALGSLHTEQYLKETKKLVSKGFQTIKFKIGIDFGTELKRLQQIRAKFPHLTIRLDANQAWSAEDAFRIIPKLGPLDIEYCEEPLQNPTPENFEFLSQQTKIPLALDESVSQFSYWPNLLPFTSYLILKPTLVGNFSKNIETKRLADTHNNKAVFTTTLESGVGRRMTAVLASGLGSSHTAHGLTTGKLLAKDVHSDMAYISNGAYHLNRHHQPRIDFQRLGDVISSLL